MPVLPNARHERFAQELAKGTSQSKAYELAGFKPSDAHACRLAGNGKVRGRVAELQGRITEAAAAGLAKLEVEALEDIIVSRGSLLREFEEARAMGKAQKNGSAMATATKGKALLLGLNLQPADELRDVTRYEIRDAPLTEEQWAATYGQPRPEERTSDEAALLRRIRQAKAKGYDVARAIDRVLAGKPAPKLGDATNGHADPFPKAAGAPELASDNRAPRPTEPSRMPAIRPRRVLS
jgi:hypothetical protein